LPPAVLGATADVGGTPPALTNQVGVGGTLTHADHRRTSKRREGLTGGGCCRGPPQTQNTRCPKDLPTHQDLLDRLHFASQDPLAPPLTYCKQHGHAQPPPSTPQAANLADHSANLADESASGAGRPRSLTRIQRTCQLATGVGGPRTRIGASQGGEPLAGLALPPAAYLILQSAPHKCTAARPSLMACHGRG
jgi:hypothetical protein